MDSLELQLLNLYELYVLLPCGVGEVEEMQKVEYWMRNKSNRPVGMMRVVHRLLSIVRGQINSSGGVFQKSTLDFLSIIQYN